MEVSIFASRSASFNAKVAAVTLIVGALMTLTLSHFSAPLAPLRIIAISIALFSAWAFCDEMGIKKPLNRGGFVFFLIAVIAKIQISLGIAEEFVGRYYLLYAAFLLLAVLAWSLAFLHRQNTLKVVGIVGLAASLAPIAIIVIGHLAVGVSAVFGVGALLSAASGNSLADLGFVTLVERIFGLWAYVAAWLLWRGHIQNNSQRQNA